MTGEVERAPDFKSVYASGVNFMSGSDDVRFLFWTQEVEPEHVAAEGTTQEVRVEARMRLKISFKAEVIMSYSLFERFATLVSQQHANLTRQRGEESGAR